MNFKYVYNIYYFILKSTTSIQQEQLAFSICNITIFHKDTNLSKQQMKAFSISQVLIYNPTLKSTKKKPIQSDIQQAKIVAYIPAAAAIQQKCNTVGMAQGVYQFGRSLLTAEQRQASNKKQLVIFMDSCCLVQKQVQEDIWVFMKLSYFQNQQMYTRLGQPQQNAYISNTITQQIALNILKHYYQSFHIFYGTISGFLFLKKLDQLQKILQIFTARYQEINRLQQTKKLDICSYIINNIRALPLDVNSTLKFDYFKNVMESYEPNLGDIVIFSHGLLAYSTLPKQTTEFFAQYLYGVGEPYKFDWNAMNKKMKIVTEITQMTPEEKYGVVFNSMSFGLTENITQSADPSRSTINYSAIKKQSNQDLLGIQQAQKLTFPQVFIIKEKQQCCYQLSYFFHKKMMFLTFFKAINQKQQIIFQNRFYYDNIDKFSPKINEIMNGVLSQIDNYKFLYCNLSTRTGKSSIDKWSIFAPQIRNIWYQLQSGSEAMSATTFQNHWVYGINRLNRLLILLVPNEVPLQKLDDFAAKMFKQYFFKAYM